MELLDRNYYRMLDDVELISAAAENPDAELAVVLGERMEAITTEMENDICDYRERAADFERDCNRLDDEKYELECEVARLEDVIDSMAEEIQQLKETAK
jgi:predicted RNase H-like nuclease (RuvC/YqgF family)